MSSGSLCGTIIAIGVALAAPVSATAQQSQVTVFNNPVEIETNQFADYPCSDAVGHAAKCEEIDAQDVAHEAHDCVDGARKHVQCVQPILRPPAPPPPGYPAIKPGPRHVILAMPSQDLQPKPELVFHDKKTSITITVSGDRRHVSAVDAKGKLLWRRDPLGDSGIDPYRFAVPRIEWVGATTSPWRQCDRYANVKNSTCISISYDSTQYGLLNLSTGEFYFLGQD